MTNNNDFLNSPRIMIMRGMRNRLIAVRFPIELRIRPNALPYNSSIFR